MGNDYLPIELDAESITIDEAAGGWEIEIHRDDDEDLYVYMEMPDPMYDQLHDAGILTVKDGEVVQSES